MPENGILSPENVRTTVVVTFALTLIALSLTFYNYVRIHQVANELVYKQQDLMDWQDTTTKRLTSLDGLEARVKALEDKSTATAEAPAPAPEPVK
jgi:hypothetical protein